MSASAYRDHDLELVAVRRPAISRCSAFGHDLAVALDGDLLPGHLERSSSADD